MSNVVRLKELEQQHKSLETEIEQEMARPMADTLKVSQLKREKLRIKEELTDLQSAQQTA